MSSPANVEGRLFVADDFIKQTNGMIMIYSLKNPSYPEFIYSTESGVMCLDIHPKHPHLLAVGFYDGSVGVFNVTERSSVPLYHSTAKTGACASMHAYEATCNQKACYI